MITRDNLSEVLDMLTEIEIKTADESGKDHILLEVSYSNACVWANLTACDHSEETESEANDNGNLFCDFDTFLQLFKDSDSINPFLTELI